MTIDFDVQIHWSWFKHQDFRRMNVEKRANLDSVLLNESYFAIIMECLFFTRLYT